MPDPVPWPAAGPLVLLDASSRVVQVGLLAGGHWLARRSTREGEALRDLFAGLREVLDEARLELLAVGGFVACDGPGSLLGLRLTGAALAGWRSLPELREAPLFCYHSLAAAALAREAAGGAGPCEVRSHHRQDTYHRLVVRPDGRHEPLELVGRDEPPATPGPVLHLRQRPREPVPPASWVEIGYDLTGLEGRWETPGLLRHCAHFAPHLGEKPDYARWSAERHRGPA